MGWTMEEHEFLRREVPTSALQTPFRNGTVQDIAKKVSISVCGTQEDCIWVSPQSRASLRVVA